MELNDEQKVAVAHQGGPAVLLASAGAGKTTVLTQRVRYIVDDGAAPNRVLGVTFTNKAANELLARLGYQEGDVQPRVTTIHSLALGFIRRDPTGFGLGHKVTPIDDYDQKVLVDTVIEKLKLPPEYKAWPFLDKTKFHRARGVGYQVDYTEDVHRKAQRQYGGTVALTEDDLRVWEAYEKAKQSNSCVDFDDMLHLVARRGREDGHWLARVQSYYDHILMDEAQDTNVVQFEFLNHLFAPGNFNGFFVGDLSQSIYSFAGASPDILQGMIDNGWRGQDVTLYKLLKNHRSVPEVVGLANRIQQMMPGAVPMKMVSHRGQEGHKGSTGLMSTGTQLGLAAEIAMSIDRDRNKAPLSDTAILVRSGSQVKDIEPELVKRKIPYVIRGASGFLQSQEVRDVLAYLRVAVNPNDYAAFKRAATTPKRGVGDVALEKLREAAEAHEGDMLKACRAKGQLLLFCLLIEELQAMKGDPIKCLEHAIKRSQYEPYLKEKVCKKDRDKLEMKMSNLERLKETLEVLSGNGLTLDDMVFQLAMNGDKDAEEAEGKVVVSTVHSSKGLEWPTVFLFGVVEGQMPHKYSQSPSEVDEERRVFYVACTRAKDRLVLGVPSCIHTSYSDTLVGPSRFLREVGIIR